MNDTTVVRAAIHPAIGVARVGNSTAADGYFIGPETPGQGPPEVYRDEKHAIKRQAARFRIYGYNAAGEAVRELTAPDAAADVKWSVHLANKKAAWYRFALALDIPDALQLDPSRNFQLRNQGVPRNRLIIDAGLRTIGGGGAPVALSGTFLDTPVGLGELRTDPAAGHRLLVLGGDGHSASPQNKPITDFANNDGWYDTVADGPVTATVKAGGVDVPVDPAWVVVAPPNYAPEVKTLRTLHDLLYDVFVQTGALPQPETVSFTDDIEPILRRFCELQWVNKGFAAHFGWKGPEYFLAPQLLDRLRSPHEEHRELRRQVYIALRDYDRDGLSPLPWPWFYGDGMASRPRSPRQNMTLSPTQDLLMQRWAAGDFKDGATRTGHRDIGTAPTAEQPALLDRAALDYCLADAFHPGCEVTWPIRHASMYTAPYRIRHRDPEVPEPSYGPQLLPKAALAQDGPLFAQGPGDLTRWMAVPWQTDTASCRWGYESTAGLGPRYDPNLPTFWPARVPNHVLKEADFETVDRDRKPGESQEEYDRVRAAAFANRAVWLRGLKGTDHLAQVRQMIDDWYKFGIVEPRPYRQKDGAYPQELHVEVTPYKEFVDVADDRNLLTLHVHEAGAAGLSAEGARAAVDSAVAELVAHTDYTEDQVVAGYIDKIDPFGDDR